MSKSKESASEAAVLDYLVSQNRPYSVNDIVQNLHKEHGKVAVQKALEKLVQDGKVREKTYGKQKVYLIDQSGLSEASPEELKTMDSRVEILEKNIKQAEIDLKQMTAELKEFSSVLTTQEAIEQNAKMLKEVEELRAKYAKLSDGAIIVDLIARDASRVELQKRIKEWRARKRMALQVLDPIVDQCPLPKKALFEEIGIETDEDVGATLPSDRVGDTITPKNKTR